MIGPQIGFNPRAGVPQVPQRNTTTPTAKTGTVVPSVSPSMTPMDQAPMTSMNAAPMTPMSPVDQRIAGLQDRMSTMPTTQMPKADTSAFSLEQIFGKGQNILQPMDQAPMTAMDQAPMTPMPQATPETLVQAPTAPVATDTAVADLVADIKNVVAEGREVEIGKLKELYPEYAGLNDMVLQDLVIDLQNVVREGREVTPERVLELYPELAGQQEMIIGENIEDDGSDNFAKFMRESAQEFTAPMVGLLQGLSDVGQRTIGALVDIPARKVAEAISGKDIERGELTRGDIMPILLGEEAETGRAKFGRGLGQFLGTAAITAPIGGAVGGLVGAKMGAATTVGQAVLRGSITGGTTGVAGTTVGSLATQDRLPTATEVIIGGTLGGLLGATIGGVSMAREISLNNKINKLITEKDTAKALREAAKEGRLKFDKPGLFGRGEATISPTERAAYARQVIEQNIKKPAWDDPQKLIQQIDDLGRQEYTKLSSELSKIPVGTMTKYKADMKRQINQIIDDSDWNKYFTSPTKKRQIQQIISDIDKAKTADDLWKIRTNFDKIFPDSVKSPRAGNFQAETLNDVWKDIRNQMNAQLDDVVREWNNQGVKDSFYKMSSLLEAKDNLITNIPTLAKGEMGVISKKELIGYIIGTAGATSLIGRLSKLF